MEIPRFKLPYKHHRVNAGNAEEITRPSLITYFIGELEKGATFTPVLKFAVLLLVWNDLLIFVSKLNGSFLLPGSDVGFAEDWVQVANCVGQLWMIWSARRLWMTLCNLPEMIKDSIASSGSQPVRKEVLSEIEGVIAFLRCDTLGARRFAYAMWTVLFCLVLLFSFAIPIFVDSGIRAWNLWPERYMSSFIVSQFWNTFTFVGVVGIGLWFIGGVTVKVFPTVKHLLDNGDLKVVPIAPDCCGGLSFLGWLSLDMTMILGSAVPFIMSWILLYGLDISTLICLPIYIALLSVAFFLPLKDIHTVMLNAKVTEEKRLSALFGRTYAGLNDIRIDHNGELHLPHDIPKVRQRLDDLACIDILYGRLEKMPVWPFDIGTLKRFGTLIAGPLLVSILQWFTDNGLAMYFGLR